MFMKNFKKILFVVLLVAVILPLSCSHFIDVNKNPNNPVSVSPPLQLTAMLGNFSYEVIGNIPARICDEWMQQLAWNGVPPSDDNYDTNESDVDNLWDPFSYINVMKNAKILDEQATKDSSFAYAGIAKVIFAWNMSIVTDLWNDVPYSQAFNPSDITPAYDSQQSIYTDLFKVLDDAIADMKKNSRTTPAGDDLLYGGDMAKWIRLAYTLKARLEMHLTKAPGMTASAQAQKALADLQNGFQSNDDNANFQYFDRKGAENPWYQFAIDGKWDTRDQLSYQYVNMLKNLNDPRLIVQARPVGEVNNQGLVPGVVQDSTYVGHPNGSEGTGTNTVSSIGRFYSNPDAPLNWMNYAEARFIEAEATFLTSGAAAADPVYRDAVSASMDQLGVPTDKAQAYIQSLPTLTSANAIEQIITQKYIANFLHFEVFNDWRRTGYPSLTLAEGAKISTIPRRFPYPATELQYNAANVTKTGVPVGYSSMTYRVWWDSK